VRLDWGSQGERFFEQGIDRGVLYVGGRGYAWTGLVSVSESIQGGQTKSYYLDGVKYANAPSSEEFEATIEAFSSPPEFAPCDGSAIIQNGLIATQQPRRSFDFSYRTRIGNGVDGIEHGYKIHLVYRALAEPANHKYVTIGANTSPSTRSWSITTLPPIVSGYRPTAHFVIDSRTVDPDVLATVENILYGDADSDPTIPSVPELMEIFGVVISDAGFAFDEEFADILDGGTP
jgi:hypothetical protein